MTTVIYLIMPKQCFDFAILKYLNLLHYVEWDTKECAKGPHK